MKSRKSLLVVGGRTFKVSNQVVTELAKADELVPRCSRPGLDKTLVALESK